MPMASHGVMPELGKPNAESGWEKVAQRIRLFHIADAGLPTVIHMDVLDADNFLFAVTQASKDLNLGCIRPH